MAPNVPAIFEAYCGLPMLGAVLNTIEDGAEASEEDIIAFCRGNTARYKVPKTVVFGSPPKTSAGKSQKFVLREKARAL